MKCEICNCNDASVHFKQVKDGETREMYVCEKCATENGFDPDSPMALTDFLFGVGLQSEPVKSDSGKKCETCGMTSAEFNKRSRVGCQFCYEVFETELLPILDDAHNGIRHVGKVPASAEVDVEIDALQTALTKAVGQEDFEEAAILRDRIRELSGKGV